MRRHLFIAAIFLLAGAVVNVAVAWGFAAWVDPQWHNANERVGGCWVAENSRYWIIWERRTTGAVRIISRWHDVEMVGDGGGFPDGPCRPLVPAWAPFVAPDDEPPTKASHAWLTSSRGWPMCSVAGALHLTNRRGPRGLVTDIDMFWAISLDEGRVANPRSHWKLRLLPFRPSAAGFAVNTLFYAAVLWLLIPGPFVLRRVVRRRRGLCVKCGYPVGETDVCSECGMTVTRTTTS